MRTFRLSVNFILLVMAIGVMLWSGHAFAGNIDPDNNGYSYAYGENVGWINLNPAGGGVTVYDSVLSGSAWGENVGWIIFNCFSTFTCIDVNYKVTNDGAGNISGYAWGENVGWINFAPAGGGVVIDPATGVFHGRAWGESIGWISFDSTGSVSYAVVTSWRGADMIPPVLTCPIDTEILAMSLTGTASTYAGIQAFLGGATAVDNADQSVLITNNAPDIFPVGQTQVTFTASDDAGNQGSCQARVTVVSPKANSNGSSSYFSEGGYNAYATFDVKYAAGSETPSGSLTFTSSRYRRKIVSTGITSLTVNGKTGVFSGPCTLNGVNGYNFTATVADNATPGARSDTFAITVTGPNGFNYSASGVIVSGEYNVSK